MLVKILATPATPSRTLSKSLRRSALMDAIGALSALSGLYSMTKEGEQGEKWNGN